MDKKRAYVILSLILVLSFFLAVYGMNWGLPDRWNTDEQIAKSLRLLAARSPFTVVDKGHPQLYNIVLAVFLAPFLLALKVTGYNLTGVQTASAVSWVNLASAYPDFAAYVYMAGRLLSAALNMASVVMVYLIGILVYKKHGIALLAALIMALSPGIAEIGHFAKCTPLVMFLMLGVIYYVFRSLKADFNKNFYIASFLSGVSTASQADGAFAVIYLTVGFFIYFMLKGRKPYLLKVVPVSLALFAIGFAVSWPAIFMKTGEYMVNGLVGLSATKGLNWQMVYIKITDNLAHIMYMFSPALAIFVYPGIIYSLNRWREDFPYTALFVSFLIPYYLFIIFYLLKYPGAYTKFTAHALPIFSLWAAAFIYKFIDWKTGLKAARSIITAIAFFLCMIYTLKADSVFAKYDTRYASGKWIEENIPAGSSIEHFQQVDLLFPSRILTTHHVIFMGKDSAEYKNKKFYDFDDKLSLKRYMAEINRSGPRSEYLVVASGRDVLLPEDMQDAQGREDIIYRLLADRADGYTLVKRFDFKESLLNPRPSYTAPTISIYKKR